MLLVATRAISAFLTRFFFYVCLDFKLINFFGYNISTIECKTCFLLIFSINNMYHIMELGGKADRLTTVFKLKLHFVNSC